MKIFTGLNDLIQGEVNDLEGSMAFRGVGGGAISGGGDPSALRIICSCCMPKYTSMASCYYLRLTTQVVIPKSKLLSNYRTNIRQQALD